MGDRLSRVVTWPLRSALRLRESARRWLSPGAVTAVLVVIGCGNVIWGYPLQGTLAAFAALLLVCGAASRLFAPRLSGSLHYSQLVRAEQWTTLVAKLSNPRQLSAYELTIAAEIDAEICRTQSSPQHIDSVAPNNRVECAFELLFPGRGVFAIADVRVTSRFPFGLFNASQWVSGNQPITVAPAALKRTPQQLSRWVQQTHRDDSGGNHSGDSYHYIGSREYQPGTAVRRWDFVSWARLSRPIVREYEQPTRQAVVIVVDLFDRGWGIAGASAQADFLASLEQQLRLAASALDALEHAGHEVQLLLTDSLPQGVSRHAESRTSMLTRMAVAGPTELGNQADWIAACKRQAFRPARCLLIQSAGAARDADQSLAETLLEKFPAVDRAVVQACTSEEAAPESDWLSMEPLVGHRQVARDDAELSTRTKPMV